eukprot:TRINITY_DN7657_c0_g1_i1.p1 TRINITY_DN7657_c0_g1~~TRINITY_DN7657_c0_g1_i1.p1  ORF type:complete len:795 (-),score=172.85 TRINITY_DN7657_c0_g1_i1:12-2357(-)
MDKINELIKTNSGFRKMFEARDTFAFSYKGLDFKAYFVTPVQRVPRYRMLFEDILKNTPHDHPDIEDLKQATERILDIALDVNEHIRRTEGEMNLARVVERGGAFASILSKPKPFLMERIWIRGGDVRSIESTCIQFKHNPKKEYELLMFSDILVSSQFTKKGTPAEYHQPINILWLEPKLGSFETIHSEHSFRVKGPEYTWTIGVSSDYERNEWVTSITETMESHRIDVYSSIRNGEYQFEEGTYSGEWVDGKMDGFGIFKTVDNWIFDGYWSSKHSSGYGYVSNPVSKKKYQSGWRINMDGTISDVRDEYGLWSKGEVSERDWALIMTGASKVVKQQDEPIIIEGKINNNLYRILDGSLRVQKETVDGDVIVLAKMNPGTVFGETAVLKDISEATASVVADDDNVELSSISINILFEVFILHPALAMRFYKDLAIKIAGKLRNLTQENKGDSGIPTQSQVPKYRSRSRGVSRKKSSKEELWKKYNLPRQAVLVSDFECQFKEKLRVKKLGHMYIFQEHVVFESRVFGQMNREKIYLGDVTNIVQKKNNTLQIIYKKKKYNFVEIQNIEDVLNLLNSLWDGAVAMSDSFFAPVTRTKTKVTTDIEYSMRSEDWDLLLTVAKLHEYEPGAIIIQEGTENERIYQIARGSCTVIKDTPDGVKILANMDGGILGEMTFIEKGPATASVIAGEYGSSVYVIEGYSIHSLFVNYPELSGRFFSYIASVIADRLNQREKTEGGELRISDTSSTNPETFDNGSSEEQRPKRPKKKRSGRKKKRRAKK